jgi:hypothetical protein
MAAMVTNSDHDAWSKARERRRFGRFAARLPVVTLRDDLVKRGQSREMAQCRLEMQDFSLGGLRGETSVRLKVNERLTLLLPPHGTHPPVELTGRVIHCERREDRYAVGVEFCQTRPEAAASPWRRVSRLFSLAFQPTAKFQPMEDPEE